MYSCLVATLAACIVRSLWITYFSKIAFTSDRSDMAWRYVPLSGWNKGQLKGALIGIAGLCRKIGIGLGIVATFVDQTLKEGTYLAGCCHMGGVVVFHLIGY